MKARRTSFGVTRLLKTKAMQRNCGACSMDYLLGETSGDDTGVHTAHELAAFFSDKGAEVPASTATTPVFILLTN